MKQAGFTLLEVLVAVAVLGMLVVMLNQGLAFGLRAAAMQGRTDAAEGGIEAVDRALRAMVERAAPTALKGSASTLAIDTELPDPVDGHLEPVEAALAVSGGQLHLRWRPRAHVRWLGPPPPPRDLVLLGGLDGVRFDYNDGAQWRADWSGDRLPALIRIRLSFAAPGRHWPPILAAPHREKP